MLETWQPIAGYEGLYEVSDLGRVRSLYRGGNILRPCLDKDGYPLVALNRDGVRKTYVLHSLVARAFHGDKRNALHKEVAHLDGVRANCRSDNLQWVSRIENQFHKRRHGTHMAGERHPRAKLTALEAAEIRLRRGRYRDIAAAYGISRYTVSDIKRGRRWTAASGDAQ